MTAALEPARNDEACVAHYWKYAALALALAGLAGSLYLSVGMGLKACPLCFYQRSFVMAVVAVLFAGSRLCLRQEVLCILTLPLAASGLGVALFHVYLEFTGKLECPQGMFGLGSAPQQALVLFTLLVAVLLGGALNGRRSVPRTGRLISVGLIIGAALAAASIWSAPPTPSPPAQPYTDPLTTCRPPYDAT